MNPISAILKSISDKKHLSIDFVKKHYSSYAVNTCYGRNIGSIMMANEINKYSHVDKELQYDFYYYSLGGRSHYGSKISSNHSKHFDAVKRYFGYNDKKTLETIDVLSSNALENIEKEVNTLK